MTERDGPMTPKAFHALFGRIGARAKMQFPIHPHMLRHGCGYALANAGHDTRALQAWLGHRNIQHTVRYTFETLLPARSRGSCASQKPVHCRFFCLPRRLIKKFCASVACRWSNRTDFS